MPATRPRRGLNLPQWLGVALLALAALYWLYGRTLTNVAPTPPTPATRPLDV